MCLSHHGQEVNSRLINLIPSVGHQYGVSILSFVDFCGILTDITRIPHKDLKLLVKYLLIVYNISNDP